MANQSRRGIDTDAVLGGISAGRAAYIHLACHDGKVREQQQRVSIEGCETLGHGADFLLGQLVDDALAETDVANKIGLFCQCATSDGCGIQSRKGSYFPPRARSLDSRHWKLRRHSPGSKKGDSWSEQHAVGDSSSQETERGCGWWFMADDVGVNGKKKLDRVLGIIKREPICEKYVCLGKEEILVHAVKRMEPGDVLSASCAIE